MNENNLLKSMLDNDDIFSLSINDIEPIFEKVNNIKDDSNIFSDNNPKNTLSNLVNDNSIYSTINNNSNENLYSYNYDNNLNTPNNAKSNEFFYNYFNVFSNVENNIQDLSTSITETTNSLHKFNSILDNNIDNFSKNTYESNSVNTNNNNKNYSSLDKKISLLYENNNVSSQESLIENNNDLSSDNFYTNIEKRNSLNSILNDYLSSNQIEFSDSTNIKNIDNNSKDLFYMIGNKYFSSLINNEKNNYGQPISEFYIEKTNPINIIEQIPSPSFIETINTLVNKDKNSQTLLTEENFVKESNNLYTSLLNNTDKIFSEKISNNSEKNKTNSENNTTLLSKVEELLKTIEINNSSIKELITTTNNSIIEKENFYKEKEYNSTQFKPLETKETPNEHIINNSYQDVIQPEYLNIDNGNNINTSSKIVQLSDESINQLANSIAQALSSN